MQKKIFFSSLFGVGLVLTITLTAIITTGNDGKFRLSSDKERLKYFYEGTSSRYIDHMPGDIAAKHQDTIARLDAHIKENNVAGAIQSTAEPFNLDYYEKILSIGILPYIEDPEFKQAIRSLKRDINDRVIDYEKLEKMNQEMFGDDLPKPTVEGTPPPEEELAHISLKGSGYDAEQAVSYAKEWTQK